MGTALWVVQGVLAIAFVIAGGMKALKSHDALKADPHMGWSNDFSAGFIQFLGLAEIAGGIGMVVPGLTGIAPVLTPVAGACLAIIMLGAAATHVRRSEIGMVFPTLMLGAMAAFVAYGRFVAMPLA